MASPRPVLRQHLASLLWSRREREQARGSLRQSVHELQDTLGSAWGHLFVADRHQLSLRGAGLEIDALIMAQPVAISPEILDRFEDQLLEDLSGLDPAFDRWLDDERARFKRIGRTIREGLLAKCDNPATAIDAAEQLLAIDRTHEGAWRAIMRGHAERGDPGAAEAAYERCRRVLAENADTRPSPETDDLIGLIRTQAAAGRPSADTAPADTSRPEPENRAPAGAAPRREKAALRLRVAPLRAIGVDNGEGLALGLTGEIYAGLSRFRWITCVPDSLSPGPATQATVRDEATTRPEADMVLDGTIQHGPGRVRIMVRLIDLRTDGEIVWAGRFDRPIEDPLSMQDELGAAIVAQVDPELMKHEGRRAAAEPPNEMTAQDLLLQALPAIYRLERTSFINARSLLEASLLADPGSSMAHGWLAYWHLLYVGQGWSPDPVESSAEANRLAERAVTLDSGDARALTLAGHVRGFLGRHPEEASTLHERAIALNPNLAIAWCFAGLACVYSGRHEEGLKRILQAIRLSPSDPHVFFFDQALTIVHLLRGDYDSAIEAGRRATEINPLFSSSYKCYLAALGLKGRDREAQEVLCRLLDLEPGFSVRDALTRSPFTCPGDIARYAEGLRRAGLHEQDPRGSGAALAITQSAFGLIAGTPRIPMAIMEGISRHGEAGNR